MTVTITMTDRWEVVSWVWGRVWVRGEVRDRVVCCNLRDRDCDHTWHGMAWHVIVTVTIHGMAWHGMACDRDCDHTMTATLNVTLLIGGR